VVEVVEAETFGSAVEMGVGTEVVGVRSYKAHRAARAFSKIDEQTRRWQMWWEMGGGIVGAIASAG